MELTLNVHALKEHGLIHDVHRVLEPEDWAEMVEGYDSYRAAGPLEITLEASRVDGGIVVEGHLRAALAAECGRCVLDFPTTLDVRVRTIYQNAPEPIEGEEEIELTEDDLEYSFYQGDSIDLLDFVRESLILELPSHPSCELDPDGRCPVHGHNPRALLTEEEEEAPIDDWKQRLLALKSEMDSN